MEFYDLTNPAGKRFFAAVDWREDVAEDDDSGQPDVWSTRSGTWALDGRLQPADLAMPEQAMNDWDVKPASEQQAKVLSDSLAAVMNKND